jgi:hypothetical protein
VTGTTTEATAGPTGILGGSFRADVTTAGTIVPWDGSASLAWHVAADDRWHSPAGEVAVRQVRTAGAPVFETRLRIPGGDAVQRIWSVADGGGRTLVEVTNESPLPIACALTRGDLLTARPPADVPIEGIVLPAGAIVLPIGHRASVTVALAHEHPAAGPLPAGSPTAEATARGWVGRAERASRVVLADERAAERLVAARADLLLTGPPSIEDDPAGFLLALHELVRLGELAGRALDDVVPDIAAAVHTTVRRVAWDVDAALAAAAGLLHVAGEDRAGRDLARLRASRAAATPDLDATADGVRGVAAVERHLAADGVLLPRGIPDAWRGVDFEAHGLPIGPGSAVSFAVRWHGAHAAVLWETDGEPVELAAPAVDATWRSDAASGEALWRLAR